MDEPCKRQDGLLWNFLVFNKENRPVPEAEGRGCRSQDDCRNAAPRQCENAPRNMGDVSAPTSKEVGAPHLRQSRSVGAEDADNFCVAVSGDQSGGQENPDSGRNFTGTGKYHIVKVMNPERNSTIVFGIDK